MDQETSEMLGNLSQELRRGSLVLAILSCLNEPRYGYALLESLAERGLQIEQGTLYPLLRRLESQGLLTSEWNVDGSRPRRYYQLSSSGEKVLHALTKDWRELTEVMEKMLEGTSRGEQSHDSH